MLPHTQKVGARASKACSYGDPSLFLCLMHVGRTSRRLVHTNARKEEDDRRHSYPGTRAGAHQKHPLRFRLAAKSSLGEHGNERIRTLI